MLKLALNEPFSKRDLERLARIIQEATGNQVLEKHHSMIESRMRSRLMKLGLSGVDAYWAYFESHRDEEIRALTSLMTTHYTFFFREYVHFEALQEWIEEHHQRLQLRFAESKTPLRVWSAACSKGQEVYSLAMFLEEELFKKYGVDYEVLGTDIDPESIHYARNGVYPLKECNSIPQHYLNQYWKRGTGAIANFAAVHPRLRKKTRFMTLNLLDLGPMKAEKAFDVIFVRNVFIYFSEEKVKSIALGLAECLAHPGVLVSGVSEPLRFEGWNMYSRAPSFYEKSQSGELSPSSAAAGAQPQTHIVAQLQPQAAPQSQAPIVAQVHIAPQTHIGAQPQPQTHIGAQPQPQTASQTHPVAQPQSSKYKVLCVDDSSTIQTLMKKIFGSDPRCSGVVAAMNGKEAREKLNQESFDLITLDIHMPVMGGIEFLETQYRRHEDPPVLMISSVNRTDLDLAIKSLSLGAVDYVEKPAMNRLKDSSDEILVKARLALRSRQASQARVETQSPANTQSPAETQSSAETQALGSVSDYNQSIGQKIVVPDASQALRWIFTNGLEEDSLEYILKTASQEYRSPAFLIMGRASSLELIEKIARSASSHPLTRLTGEKIPLLKPNAIYTCDIAMGARVAAANLKKKVSLQFLHNPEVSLEFLKPLAATAQVLVDEELSGELQPLLLRDGLRVSDITPSTSFVSLSLEFFAKLRGARAA